MWDKTTIKQLKEGDKIKYVTTAGSYIVFFKGETAGKNPSLSTYVTENGKKVYKRPKITSIKEVYIWKKPEVVTVPEGFTKVFVRDAARIIKDTIITIHKKDGTVLDEVVFIKGTPNVSLEVFTTTGQRRNNLVIPISDVAHVFTSDKTFNDEVDYRYELIAPRDYYNLYNILKKGDLIAHTNKDGKTTKNAKVLSVQTANGKVQLKVQHFSHFYTIYPSSMSKFYVKKTDLEKKEKAETNAVSAAESPQTETLDTSDAAKIKYLYDELKEMKKLVITLQVKNNVQDAQINKLRKHILKLYERTVDSKL
tara:strand:+ start:274 stop:1200 length:927 start_codon:yes stop_codon:yes gene_type:complete